MKPFGRLWLQSKDANALFLCSKTVAHPSDRNAFRMQRRGIFYNSPVVISSPVHHFHLGEKLGKCGGLLLHDFPVFSKSSLL